MKVGHLRLKKNPKQYLKNSKPTFKKAKKTTFLVHKIIKSWVTILEKKSIFGCILDLKA